jgi:hypothetical protein
MLSLTAVVAASASAYGAVPRVGVAAASAGRADASAKVQAQSGDATRGVYIADSDG